MTWRAMETLEDARMMLEKAANRIVKFPLDEIPKKRADLAKINDMRARYRRLIDEACAEEAKHGEPRPFPTPEVKA